MTIATIVKSGADLSFAKRLKIVFGKTVRCAFISALDIWIDGFSSQMETSNVELSGLRSSARTPGYAAVRWLPR